MDFVELNFTISVCFSTMIKEDYDEFAKIFRIAQFKNEPIDNKKLIDLLSLEKRPFHVSTISLKKNAPHKSLTHNAEIELVC